MSEEPVIYGSKWEANIYAALVQQKKQFDYQVSFFGGQRLRGGTIVDFIVYTPDAIVVYVDGPQWHNKKKADDQIVRAKLERIGYIVKVVEGEAETIEGANKWVKENLPQ